MRRKKEYRKLLRILDEFVVGREISTFNIERDVKQVTSAEGTIGVPGNKINIEINLLPEIG